MISCTEFIAAYNELFKFLEKKSGKEAVIRFWEDLSDNSLGLLHKYAKAEGVAGCFKYWSHTLPEEAADFRIAYDKENQVMISECRRCPSLSLLLEAKHIEPYKDYCGHCDLLYRRALERYGIEFKLDMSRCHEAICGSVIRKMPQTK